MRTSAYHHDRPPFAVPWRQSARRRAGLAGLLSVFVLGAAVSCAGEPGGDGVEGDEAQAATETESRETSPGLAAAERFMETWNTRDAAVWATSLHFPHVRPGPGTHGLSPDAEEYAANFDYGPILETGWDHTEFEELEVVHQGDDKAHVVGRWGRVDGDGNKIRRNLVAYIATEIEGAWGVQARFSAGPPVEGEVAVSSKAAALAKVEEYMAAFNARDPVAWAATLNYPHVRVASGDVRVWETEEEYADFMDFDAFAESFGWDHSAWDQMEAVQVSESGVNVALTFSRYNAENEVIATFNTLYLVTNENGRWGVRARSSFAP